MSGSPTETSEPSLPVKVGTTIIGIMGAFPEDFDLIREWGARTVEYHKSDSAEEVQAALDAAKASNLNIFVKGVGKDLIQSPALAFDLQKVEANLADLFAGNHIAADEAFVGYWIVDEPCHENKWALTAGDMKALYSTAKGVHPDIPVVINFGNLLCFEQFVDSAQPGWKMTDIAMFTITPKKVRDGYAYIADQNEIARRIKEYDPGVKVIPQIAVLEHLESGTPLPSADWVRDTGLETLSYDSFDGILYYSFNSISSWMGETIASVQNDPAYVNAFQEVFRLADEKW